jgi:hypothetical protein
MRGYMAPLDWIVIVAYFLLLAWLTWWAVKKSKETADDYFLAGRNLGWIIVGASIFASNIGSEHLVGLAGSGATSGVAMAHYELHAWAILVLGGCSSRSTPGRRSTRCRSSWNAGSRRRPAGCSQPSRWSPTC